MLVSFKSHRVSTTANTVVTPAVIVGARLVAATSATLQVHIHDASGTTSAATRIATLTTAAIGGIDEVGYPLRVQSQRVVVSPTGTSATLYLFVR